MTKKKKKLHNQCKYLAINNEEPYEKGAGHGPKNNRTHKNRIIYRSAISAPMYNAHQMR